MQFSTAIALLTLLIVSPAEANQDWETTITVKAGVAKNKLMLGQNSKATDGIDGLFEVPAMLSGNVKASFPSAIGSLWRDIKAHGQSKFWTMNVESNQANVDITIRLDTTRFPSSYSLYMTDKATGSTINIAQSGFYKYKNTGPRTFKFNSIAYSTDTTETESPEKNILIVEPYETSDGSTKYRSAGVGHANNENNTNPVPVNTDNYSSTSPVEGVAKEYESYYKASAKKLSEQVAGKLKEPSKIKGWIKNKKGLFIEWEDKSGGEHGFILEKMCSDEKSWSLVAALWGVKPTYSNRKATIKQDGLCEYRIIAFNHITESDYSDTIIFNPKGELEIIEKKDPTPPLKEQIGDSEKSQNKTKVEEK